MNIGRTEIPKWIGQDFDVWKKELEKWNENDKSSDETKYHNLLESLKKNDKIKDFVVSTLTEKTENDRTVVAILRVMGEKYWRTVSEKCLSLMADMANFKMEGGIEITTDKFRKIMTKVRWDWDKRWETKSYRFCWGSPEGTEEDEHSA